ncbi:MAG TPA: hypothetical protein VGR00_09245, partial [Thermoanaerobaculia bacterium]|nr:hypothetical protein [Thermoanaerobaculia bacterium]
MPRGTAGEPEKRLWRLSVFVPAVVVLGVFLVLAGGSPPAPRHLVVVGLLTSVFVATWAQVSRSRGLKA